MPCKDPEKRKEYNKTYHEKHKEKIKEKKKEYYEEHKEKLKAQKKEYLEKNKEKIKEQKKEWYENNKEKIKEQKKEYRQTPKAMKSSRISDWIRQGIICSNFSSLHDIYISTTHCHFCKCLLNQSGSSRKCVDHDHDIHDKSNVRGILCNSCNINDVLNIID